MSLPKIPIYWFILLAELHRLAAQLLDIPMHVVIFTWYTQFLNILCSDARCMLLTIPNHWKHTPSIYTFDSPTFNATVHYLVFGHHPSDHAFHRHQTHFIMHPCCYYSITSPPCDVTYICSLHPSFFATRSKVTLLIRARLYHSVRWLHIIFSFTSFHSVTACGAAFINIVLRLLPQSRYLHISCSRQDTCCCCTGLSMW